MERVELDRGSIPLALLALIAVGAVASLLASTMVGGQRHARFDQSDEQSLQLAEVGLERMAAQITTRQASTSFALPASPGFAGTATRADDGWVLTATGTAGDGTRRTVQATIEYPSIFQFAAFGGVGVELEGDNRADSYRSGTWSGVGPTRTFDPTPVDDYLDAANRVVPSTSLGLGRVGTNGRLLLKGSAIHHMDAAWVYHASEHVANPLPGATGSCSGVVATCDARGADCETRPCLRYRAEPLEFPPVVPPSAPLGAFDGRDGNVLPAGVSVFTSAYLDETTDIQGTPTDPSIVFLTGQLSIANHARVNFTSHGPGRKVPRPSPSLRIYSSSEGTALSIGSHAQISAAIYAPKGAFGGGSQGHVWGSLVANSIRSNGGTEFHYDVSLEEVDDVSPLVMGDWVETAPVP